MMLNLSIAQVMMQITDPVLIFALVMLIILVAPMAMSKMGIPAILGLILAGTLVGPHGLGLLARSGAIELLGTVGLLYLMFLAGLEIDLHQFMHQRNRSLVFGGLTFLIPQVVGMLGAKYLLGFGWATSILLASMFASHTPLTYPIFSRLGIAKNRAVSTAIGGTILTDTAALLVLAVVAEATVRQLTAIFWVRQMLLLALLVVALLWGLPRLGYWFFRRIALNGIVEFVFILAAAFLSSYLASLAGVEPIVGAFLAGLALSRLVPETGALMNRLKFMGDAFFIPFFLISVGMLVNLRVFVKGVDTWIISVFMLVVVLATKLAAAILSGRVLGFTREEGFVIFGLSVNQAAATLAAVLVGYRIGLFNEAVLNGTIVMILGSCVAGAWAAESYGRKVVLMEKREKPRQREGAGPVIVPLANRETADLLMELALAVRPSDARAPIYPLHVVQEGPDAEDRVVVGEKLMAEAIVMAVAAEASVVPILRIDVNAADGIMRAQRELHAGVIVAGWNTAGGRGFLFHTVLDQVIQQSRAMVFAARLVHPLNTTKRVVLTAPPLLDRHQGFGRLVETITALSKRIGGRLVVVGTQPSIDAVESELGKSAPPDVEYVSIDAWERIGRELSGMLSDHDLLVLLNVRRGRLAWQPFLDRLPVSISREFPNMSFIVAYPRSAQAEPEEFFEPMPAPSALPSFLPPRNVRRDMDGMNLDNAVRELVRTVLPEQSAQEREVSQALLAAEPVELTAGVALLHAHVEHVNDVTVLLGLNKSGFRHSGLETPANALFVLLSPRDLAHVKHLETLAKIARLVQNPDFAQTIQM